MLKTSIRFNSLKRSLALTGVLLVGSLAIDFVPTPVQAGSARSVSIQNKQLDGQVPGRVRGGARRGNCPSASTELTALAPMTEDATRPLPKTYVGGRTTAEHPTMWFYVPYALTADRTAEFILQDDTGKDLYRVNSTNFPASEQTPGIIGIALPSTIAPLEIGKVYQWYFKLKCGLEAPIYVQGGIKRIPLAPTLASQLANASPQEQANLYLANHAWYDAVAVLAQLHRTKPTDQAISAAWTDLLRSIGLGDLATN